MTKCNSDSIRKIYIEPTSRCNLNCKMCPRNTWTNERIGDMDMHLFQTLLYQVKGISSLETIFFGGVAEPMSHPEIITMVKQAKNLNVRVELISNGSLLDEDIIEQLLMAGLDKLWVSIDKDHTESQGKSMSGGYNKARANLFAFNRIKHQTNSRAEFGIAFVAMKSNIHELPDIINLGLLTHASEIKVSNVIPYTKEMQQEMLYEKTLSHSSFREEDSSNNNMLLNMPIMDLDKLPQNVINSLLWPGENVKLGENMLVRKPGHCKFIQEDSLFIRWDGEVCPCMALLHNNKTYLQDVERQIHFCSFGNINNENLKTIWESDNYSSFRKRVKEFSFSPCTMCGLCSNAESNEEDCFGNTFPTCGACLWAEGFAQCP